MFTNISWGSYIVVIVLLLASWYLFVGLRFYLNDIKEIATGKRKLRLHRVRNENYQEFPSQLNEQGQPAITSSESSFGEFDNTFNDVDNLVEQLKNVINDAAKRKLLKQECIVFLRSVLQEYPSIKFSPFKSSVSELIVSECAKLDYMVLTQTEAEALWN